MNLKFITDELNRLLKQHPQYEPWMSFITVKEEDHTCTPLVQNPKCGETELDDGDWMNVYRHVIHQLHLR